MKQPNSHVSDDWIIVPCTRAEIEAVRTDEDRFKVPDQYKTEEDLKWFHSEENRQLFRERYL